MNVKREELRAAKANSEQLISKTTPLPLSSYSNDDNL
jgi:hypothetical protein